MAEATPPQPESQPIEIGESPEASSQIATFDGPDQSLFIPLDDAGIPSQDFAAVHPSAPPSSYQSYRSPESSQIVSGVSAQASSQIQHPPRSTADATSQVPPEVLATSQKVPSQTALPASGSGRVVPDSQSLPTSLEFVSQTPNATHSNNSAADNQLVQDLQVVAQASPRVQQTSSAHANSAVVEQLPNSPSQRQSLVEASQARTGVEASESGTAGVSPADRSINPEQPDEEAIFVATGNSQVAPNFVFSSQIEREARESVPQHLSPSQTQANNQQEAHPPVESTESVTSFPFETQVGSNNTEPRPNSQPARGSKQPLLELLGQPSRAASFPLGGTSSQLPTVPSQLLPAIGESAPPQPDIPSTPTRPSSADMEQRTPTTEPVNELHAQIRAMRAKKNAERRTQTPSAQGTPVKPSAVPPRLNAELAAETPGHAGSPDSSLNGGRSPSAVPAALPVHAATQEEMNTSERYKTLLPQAKENSLRRQSTITGIASNENSKPGNYVHSVPVALMGHQRDAYPTMIQQHKELIERFLGTSQPSDDLAAEIETLLERLRRIVVHPDLDNVETWTQYDVPPAAHAQWAIDCSAKFGFLKHLIDELKDKTLSIAVICQAPLLHILENFLLGFKVTCHRMDTGQRTEHDGCALTFNIMSPNEDVSPESISADVVVCLDNSAEAGGSALKLLQEGMNKPLMMTFVVPSTVEHVERCLSPDLTHQQRLRATMHGVFDLRYDAGKLEHGQLPSVESAKVIANYIKTTDSDKEWAITALSMLENLDSQTESDIALPLSGAATHVGDKRSLETSEAELSPTASFKRPRLELNGTQTHEQPTTINPLQLDISHVSDSVDRLDSSAMDPAELATTNKRLQALLFETQAKLAEHEKAMSDLQYRHEAQRNELIDVTRKYDEAMDTAQRAVTRMTEGASTTSTLRAQVRALKEERDAANAALADHSVPDRAAFEQQRIALAHSQAEKEKLEQRLKTQQGDLDYAQEMYQNSSSGAQRLAATNKELENSLAHAQNRASGEQARAKQMTLDARALNLSRENKQLKARVKEQADALLRKDKELVQLKEASRGRMGTRGTSVPGSPRMASPLKNVAGGGSRQSSPAAGELRGRSHPLRQGG